jgi:uncharacterized protein
MSQTRAEVISAIKAILARHPYVRRASLFGSLARGEDRPDSDVDLLLDVDEAARPRGLAFFRLHDELEEAVGRPVDVVQEKTLYNFVRQGLAADRVQIYERT